MFRQTAKPLLGKWSGIRLTAQCIFRWHKVRLHRIVKIEKISWKLGRSDVPFCHYNFIVCKYYYQQIFISQATALATLKVSIFYNHMILKHTLWQTKCLTGSINCTMPSVQYPSWDNNIYCIRITQYCLYSSLCVCVCLNWLHIAQGPKERNN